MSILVIDSGSSKAEWLWSDGQNTESLTTDGINVATKLVHFEQFERLSDRMKDSDQVIFYGAGISDSVHAKKAIEILKTMGLKGYIHAESDLLGAARALFGREEGIACILGTGANSAYYNGEQLKYSRPALGFIIGDEGSGANIGKEILRQYFYHLMPQEIEESFFEQYQMTKQKLIQDLYTSHGGAKYLASFSLFLNHWRQHPWVFDVLSNEFSSFIHQKIQPLHKHNPCKVGFVGSIAFFNSDVLTQLLLKNGIACCEILKNPVNRLLDYHLKYT